MWFIVFNVSKIVKDVIQETNFMCVFVQILNFKNFKISFLTSHSHLIYLSSFAK